MAANVGGSKGGAKAEINITPLVDVVLVLLIIFMVISPGTSNYIPDSIPRTADEDESVVLTDEQLVLQLKIDGTASLNRQPVHLKEFAKKINELMTGRIESKLFIAVDDELPYGEVINWMGVARKNGVHLLALQVNDKEEIKLNSGGA